MLGNIPQRNSREWPPIYREWLALWILFVGYSHSAGAFIYLVGTGELPIYFAH